MAASDFPDVNLPYIIDGDLKLSQTLVVQHYICNKWCPALLGDTPEKRAKAYQMQLLINDASV